jgi:N-acetylmuramoyl-L-alanine amidase
MGKPTLVIFVMLATIFAQAQISDESREFYKERAERNLKYLVQDSILLNQVTIDDEGIKMYDLKSTVRPEFTLYWDEVPHYLRIINRMRYYDEYEMYYNKGNDEFLLTKLQDLFSFTMPRPEGFLGLRVAIDPGHFAGNWEQALKEERYLKVRGEEFGKKGDIQIYEAQLTYWTAEILKDTLEKLGSRVMLTRPKGVSAVGKSFDDWYREDFRDDLAIYIARGDISEKTARALLESNSRRYVFEVFYKYIDFTNRARRMNEFKPNLSLVLHYNVEESNNRDKYKYTSPQDEANYSMFFVPGSFLWGELWKQNQRMDFLRLMVGYDLEQSIRLAKHIQRDHKDVLGVPPIPVENDLIHTEKYDILTDYQGVYARNLYLTRAVKGPVVYCESLYQDHRGEMERLIKRDYSFNGEMVPKRCAEVAFSFLRSMRLWLEENKEESHIR